MLSPSFIGIETLLGVLEPEELSLASLGVGAGSDEILAAITVEVNPVAHMIEETLLLL